MASTAVSVFATLETRINTLPVACKYRCTSDNKELTRNIQRLTEKEQRELKEKLDTELANFEELYKQHKDIDHQCMKLIDTQLEVIRSDPKMKDVYKTLSARYKIAKEATGSVFLGTSDRCVGVSSVMGTKLLNFIITFHRHHCQYTNMFKHFCGDTTKEVKRLEMILGCRTVASSPSTSDLEEDSVSAIKNKIAAVELDIDEDW